MTYPGWQQTKLVIEVCEMLGHRREQGVISPGTIQLLEGAYQTPRGEQEREVEGSCLPDLSTPHVCLQA